MCPCLLQKGQTLANRKSCRENNREKRKKEKRGDKKGNQTKQKIKETKTPPTPTTKIYKKMLLENTNWKKRVLYLHFSRISS